VSSRWARWGAGAVAGVMAWPLLGACGDGDPAPRPPAPAPAPARPARPSASLLPSGMTADIDCDDLFAGDKLAKISKIFGAAAERRRAGEPICSFGLGQSAGADGNGIAMVFDGHRFAAASADTEVNGNPAQEKPYSAGAEHRCQYLVTFGRRRQGYTILIQVKLVGFTTDVCGATRRLAGVLLTGVADSRT
jgi:hypothetical protein